MAYAELAVDAEAKTLVDAFTEARLLVCDRTREGEAVVEVAHEALLREWPRLADWIAERAEDFCVRRHAEISALEWRRKGSKPNQLWHHEILLPVYEALERLDVDLTKLAEPLKSFLRPEAEQLLAQLLKLSTPHHRRAEIGDRLDSIGDPRPGVGLRPDGIPDLIWCAVPPGKVRLEEVEKTFKLGACFIARYPVTYRQYRAFLDDPEGYHNPAWWKDLQREEKSGQQYRPIGTNPAENFSWFDAMAYCRWLNAKLGYEVRLPTEWEWQQAFAPESKACKSIRLPPEWASEHNCATKKRSFASLRLLVKWERHQAALSRNRNRKNEFPWGSEWDTGKANTYESGLGRTIAVGMYPLEISHIGALDLVGNVWEWCLGPAGDGRVVRGGSWYHGLIVSRCADRYHFSEGYRHHYIGFRLVCVSPIL